MPMQPRLGILSSRKRSIAIEELGVISISPSTMSQKSHPASVIDFRRSFLALDWPILVENRDLDAKFDPKIASSMGLVSSVEPLSAQKIEAFMPRLPRILTSRLTAMAAYLD